MSKMDELNVSDAVVSDEKNVASMIKPSGDELPVSNQSSIRKRRSSFVEKVRSANALVSEFKGLSVSHISLSPCGAFGRELFPSEVPSSIPHTKHGGDEEAIQTPKKIIKRESTLRDGEEINIWQWKNIGFIMQYFAVGVIYGGLPSTIYGVFLGYLNVPGYVYSTACVIVSLPWSFKFLFGMMNDCVPIMGYRRKPYMVFGWTLCFVMLIVLSFDKMPPPYFCVDEDGDYIKTIYNETLGKDVPAEPCNPGASTYGGHYALMMALTALGYVIADVAADGLMVIYAQKEPEEKRGSTQTTIYMVRTIGSTCAVALVGLGMNGKEYAGMWKWTLHYNEICGIFALPAGLMAIVSWFCVYEEPVHLGNDTEVVDENGEKIEEGPQAERILTLREYMTQCWKMLTSKAFFFVVMYNFFEPFVGRIATTAGGYVKKEWAGVQNIQNQMFSLVSLCIFAFGLYQVKKRFLNYSWRKMLFATAIFLNLVDMSITFVTTYDVLRNQYFYLGESVLSDIPNAANFVVSTFIIVEMADHGSEGVTYGLLTTIGNLGMPFAIAVGNQIFGQFKPNLSEVQNYITDTPEFRNTVASSFGLSYVFTFLGMMFVLFLPDQKAQAQQRKRDWPRSNKYGYIILALISFGLAYSLTVDIMAMIPSTMCLQFAGGSGCD